MFETVELRSHSGVIIKSKQREVESKQWKLTSKRKAQQREKKRL